MAVIMDKPHPTLPKDYRPPGGVPYRVKNGDNWETIAARLGMPPRSLIFFNYHTSEPKYVNYYLKHNVGCTTVSPDGKNYSFWNAAPGIIYVPGPGSGFVWAANPVLHFNVTQQGTYLPLQENLGGPRDRHGNPATVLCPGRFNVYVEFSTSVPDVTRLVYRQFIRGRMRTHRRNSQWVSLVTTGIKVPPPGVPPGRAAILQPIDPTTWMEDGELDVAGKVRRYGYREEDPQDGITKRPLDLYLDPPVTRPPQTGYKYNCEDTCGITNGLPKTHVGGELDGLSIRLEFNGVIYELQKPPFPPLLLQTKVWEFICDYEITSINPLQFKIIPPP